MVRRVIMPIIRHSLFFFVVVMAAVACGDSSDPTNTAADAADARGFAPNDADPPDIATPGDLDGGIPGDAELRDAAPVPDLAPLPDADIPNVCLQPPARETQTPIEMGAQCRRGNDPIRIRDLRDPRCPDALDLPDSSPGPDVNLREAIVTGIFDPDFAIADPEGGPYAGVYVFNRVGAPIDDLQVGDRVRVRGHMISFFTLDELVLEEREGAIERIGGGPAPEPVYVEDPLRLADGGDLVEILESQLVEVRSVRVTTTAPDCPNDFGMFVVDGALRFDDRAEFDYAPARGDLIERIVGVLHYSFNHQKIFPRGNNDIDAVACGGTPDKCESAECAVELDAEETGEIVITEIQNNPRGSDDDREYVELYNPSTRAVDLDGWTLRTCSGLSTPLSNRLEPFEYFVAVKSLDRDANGGVRGQITLGEIFLSNDFGDVLVFDANERLVDQVRYEPGGDDSAWPMRDPGVSLQLIEAAADNRDPAAWDANRENEYGDGGWGTPGGAIRR